jgi:hypothetical protein
VADDHRRAAVLARELSQEPVDLGRVRVIELARRLVREEDPRLVRQRRADGEPLLLSARELVRARAAAVAEADPGEQLVGPGRALSPPLAAQAELQRDQLAGRQLGRERPRVVLVGITERRGPVVRQLLRTQLRQLRAEDADRAGGGPLEPREDPEQRRLAGPARAQHRQHLALAHAQGEALERRGVSLRRRVDAEQVANFDRGRHVASVSRPGASPRNAVRVARSASSAAARR